MSSFSFPGNVSFGGTVTSPLFVSNQQIIAPFAAGTLSTLSVGSFASTYSNVSLAYAATLTVGTILNFSAGGSLGTNLILTGSLNAVVGSISTLTVGSLATTFLQAATLSASTYLNVVFNQSSSSSGTTSSTYQMGTLAVGGGGSFAGTLAAACFTNQAAPLSAIDVAGSAKLTGSLSFPIGSGVTWGAGPYSAILDNNDLNISTDDTMRFNIGLTSGTLGTTQMLLTNAGLNILGTISLGTVYGTNTLSSQTLTAILSANQTLSNSSAGGTTTYARSLLIKAGDSVGSGYWGGSPSAYAADLTLQAGNMNIGTGNNGTAYTNGFGGYVRIFPGFASVSTTNAASSFNVNSGQIWLYSCNTNGINQTPVYTPSLIVNNYGSVGILNTNPSYPMDINGSCRVSNSGTNTLTPSLICAVGTVPSVYLCPSLGSQNYSSLVQSGDAGLVFGLGSYTASSAFVLAPWSGSNGGIRVTNSGTTCFTGINLASPANSLDVLGTTRLTTPTSQVTGPMLILSSTVGPRISFVDETLTGSVGCSIRMTSGWTSQISTGGYLALMPGGSSVGINTSSPNYNLEVRGNCGISGMVSCGNRYCMYTYYNTQVAVSQQSALILPCNSFTAQIASNNTTFPTACATMFNSSGSWVAPASGVWCLQMSVFWTTATSNQQWFITTSGTGSAGNLYGNWNQRWGFNQTSAAVPLVTTVCQWFAIGDIVAPVVWTTTAQSVGNSSAGLSLNVTLISLTV